MHDRPAVCVRELRKTYRSGLLRRRKVEALRGVSFEVQRGEIFGLLGPNGAGKTTLIKVLLGLVKRFSGHARVLDFPAGSHHGRMRIGYLPENHRIPRHLTGNTALEYYGQLSHLSVRAIRAKRGELLASVGLSHWGSTSVASYSKGMLQRLGLAQAMLHDPELLILDEPTDGVDPVGRADIRDTLFQLKERGKTIFLNSHLLQELELVCNRVAILQKGAVRHVGPIQELTQTSTTGVTFRVKASQQQIQSAMLPVIPSQVDLHPDSDADFSVFTIESTDQSVIDRLVDAFRQADLSIVSIVRRQLTLEEAFLQLVDRDSPVNESSGQAHEDRLASENFTTSAEEGNP